MEKTHLINGHQVDSSKLFNASTPSWIVTCLQSKIPFRIQTLPALLLNRFNNFSLDLLQDALITTTSVKRVSAHYECIAFPKIASTLISNKSVTTIDLLNNVEYCAVDILAKIIQKNNTLTDLQLFGCQIGSEGCSKISEALKGNKTLKRLNLMANKIDKEGMKALSDALKVNKSLEHLIIGNNAENALIHLFDGIQANDTLTRLDLSQTNFSDEESNSLLTTLAENNSIHTLDLNGCNFTHQGWASIAALIEESDTLTDLDLSTLNLKAIDCDKISKALINNDTIKVLKIGSKNMSMSLDSMNIDRAIARAIKNNKSLTELQIHKLIMNNTLMEICEGLKYSKTLSRLYIREVMDLKDFGFEAFTEAMNVNPTLTSLDIGSYCIDQRAYAAFREFLYNNFTSLTLRSCVTRQEEIQILYDRLNVHSTLKSFSLKGCDSTKPEAFLLFSAILTSNTVLRSLDISDIKIEKSFPVCRALKHNQTLTKLVMDGTATNLDRDAHRQYYKELAEILKSNRSLRILDLSTARIDSSLAAELFNIVKYNDFIVDIRTEGDQARILSPELAERLEENMNDFLRLKEMIFNSIMNMYILARNESTRDLLPVEMWTFIFGFIQFPDVKLSFDSIGQQIWSESFVIRKLANRSSNEQRWSRSRNYTPDRVSTESKTTLFTNKAEKYQKGLKYTLGGILVANTALLCAWQAAELSPDDRLQIYLEDNFSFSYYNYYEGRYWTPLTSSISHSRLQHFWLNMGSLCIIAQPLYRRIGPTRFLAAYMLGALGAVAGDVLGDIYTNGPVLRTENQKLQPIIKEYNMSASNESIYDEYDLTKPDHIEPNTSVGYNYEYEFTIEEPNPIFRMISRGASGSICALMALTMIVAPNEKIHFSRTLFFVHEALKRIQPNAGWTFKWVRVDAKIFVPFLIAVNLLALYAANSPLMNKNSMLPFNEQQNLTVSNSGHLGGFLTGFAMYLLFPLK